MEKENNELTVRYQWQEEEGEMKKFGRRFST
jgi:hypothetical protein